MSNEIDLEQFVLVKLSQDLEILDILLFVHGVSQLRLTIWVGGSF